MFQSGECVHFVFADRNDRYFCSSGLILSLEKYLYLQLRREKYGEVYFLRKNQDGWILEFSENEKKFFSPENGKKIWQKPAKLSVDHLVRQLTDILNRNIAGSSEKTAVVMNLTDFTELCETAAEKMLIRLIAAASNSFRENILVLCCPDDSGGSYSALFETKAFRTCVKGHYLSEAAAAVKRGAPNPFDQLRRQCKSRGNYVVLNSKYMDEREDFLVNEQLKALADCLLLRHKAWHLRENPYLVPGLYIAMRSETMQKKLQIHHPTFCGLYKQLSGEEHWNTFLKEVNGYAEYRKIWNEGSLISTMRELLFDFSEIAGGVCVRDDISGACGDTALPEWYTQANRKDATPSYLPMGRNLAEIRRCIHTPRWTTNPTAKRYFLEYMDFLREEKKKPLDDSDEYRKNPVHLKNAVQAAVFAAEHLGDETVSEEFCRYCNAYAVMLQTECRYYEVRRRQREQSQGTEKDALTVYETLVQQERENLEIARRGLEDALEELNRSSTAAEIRTEKDLRILEEICGD